MRYSIVYFKVLTVKKLFEFLFFKHYKSPIIQYAYLYVCIKLFFFLLVVTYRNNSLNKFFVVDAKKKGKYSTMIKCTMLCSYCMQWCM